MSLKTREFTLQNIMYVNVQWDFMTEEMWDLDDYKRKLS